MTTIQLMACIGMVVGFFVLLGITPSDFTEGVFRQITSKPKSLRDEINESTQRKKKFVLRREIEESQNILRMTGREAKFPAICAMSLLLFLVGASFAFLLGNFFLVPVLAAGMMFIPFWYIKLTAAYFKKAISAELETALSIITTSYLRNEDIQTAVEENLEYLNPPVKNAFAEFLTRIKLVDPDVDAALRDLSTKIDNAVFREWVAALLTCRYDRGMKTTLTPIVAKLSDMRIVNGDLENMVFEPRKEFIVMQILVLGNIPLLYFLNQEWYDTPHGPALQPSMPPIRPSNLHWGLALFDLKNSLKNRPSPPTIMSIGPIPKSSQPWKSVVGRAIPIILLPFGSTFSERLIPSAMSITRTEIPNWHGCGGQRLIRRRM